MPKKANLSNLVHGVAFVYFAVFGHSGWLLAVNRFDLGNSCKFKPFLTLQ